MSVTEYINSAIISTNTSNVTFSSIPGHYTDLLLTSSARGSSGNSFQATLVQLNSDTLTNYSTTLLYDSGTSALSTRTTNADCFTYLDVAANGSASNIFGIMELNFMSYSNTNIFKSVLAKSTAGSVQVRVSSHIWRSTNSISSIKIYPSVGEWLPGSTFSLWGIK